MKSFFSKLTLGITGAAFAAFQSGLLPPKIAAYTALGLAVAQSFQPRVQQSASDVIAADSAVAMNKSPLFKQP